jgi:4-amino-4-deoxy-L-arabinose transferase-like glycosyltransferase
MNESAVMKRWQFLAAVTFLTLIAVVRVAATHDEFSATLDEPVHLADGYEWFAGRYALDPSHPPLARVLGALPLRLAGIPESNREGVTNRGNDVLYHGGAYLANLGRARRGNLLLLVVAIGATAAWARRRFSPGVALLAVAVFTSLPPVLGHAGVITTDLAVTAAFALALAALEAFLDHPSRRRALGLGGAIGVGVLAKMSFLVYFPPAAILLFLARRRLPSIRHAILVVVAAFVVLWGGYRFDVGKPSELSRDAVFLFHYTVPEPFIGVARWSAQQTMPAPAFALGLASLKFHDQQGHRSYLLGETSESGWWYYFPVVFFYKTPIPLLLLLGWGMFLKPARIHSAIAVAVLVVAMTGSINIGVRHILPMYVPLAIVAGLAVADVWRRASGAFGRVVIGAIVGWLIVGSAVAHPDYLAWFNGFAQPDPSRIAVDSNLDWGQDVLRLGRTAKAMGIDTLHVDVVGTIHLEPFVRPVPFDANVKTPGWVAVSETQLAMKSRDGAYGWLRSYRPVARVGESIRLYRIP